METSLHRMLKAYYAVSPDQTEIRIGKFRIDAIDDQGRLVEVQHAGLSSIRSKISQLLPDHSIRIIKPIIANKWIATLDEGKLRRASAPQPVRRRKSPKRGHQLDIFFELVHFTKVFPHPNLTIEVPFIDIEETRIPRKNRRWKSKQYKTMDQTVLQIGHSIHLNQPADLLSLIEVPPLTATFDTAMLAKWIDRPRWFAQKVAYVLHQCGATKEVGRSGNTRNYQFNIVEKKTPRSPKMKKSKFVGVLVWLACLFFFPFASAIARDNEKKTQSEESISILFVGDIMLDGGPGHALMSGTDPFEKCAELLQSTDLTIGNLECVVGREGKMILKAYSFRAAKGSTLFLKKYFDALSLANNHTFDFGPEGITSSLDVLEKDAIRYFGAGKNISEARKPLILECKGKRIGLLGYNDFRSKEYAATGTTAGNVPLNATEAVNDIRQAKNRYQCDIIIPYLHWGDEMEPHPLPEQTKLARQLVDAGATAVIGTHAHVTQTIDVYNGAPIVYSLGNFVFDYFPGDPKVWTGWAFKMVIKDDRVNFETFTVEMDRVGLPYLK